MTRATGRKMSKVQQEFHKSAFMEGVRGANKSFRAKWKRQVEELKLRWGKKFIVADPYDVEFGKRIPLVCHYRGRKEGRHIFTFKSNFSSGYRLTDRDVARLVEPWTKERVAEARAEAEYYNEHGKLMPSPGRL